MKKFREKPVVVEAEQWFPDHPIEGVIPSYPCSGVISLNASPQHAWMGDHLVTLGDWIIKGADGERFVCTPDVFEERYEPIPEELWYD